MHTESIYSNNKTISQINELHRSLALMQTTLESTREAIIITDIVGNVIFFNQKYFKLWQIPENLKHAKNHTDLLTACTQQIHNPNEFLNKIQTIYKSAENSLDILELKSGKVIERTSKAQFYEGVYVGRIWSFLDLTSESQTADALHKSDELNRKIINSSRDCIKMLSLTGHLEWMSDAGHKLLGITDPNQVIGKCWLDFWEGEQRNVAEYAMQEAKQGRTGNFIGHFMLHGKKHWFDVAITPIMDKFNQAEKLLAISRNVTERNSAEEALREETRILEILNKTGASIGSTLDIQTLLQTVTDASTQLSGAKFGAFFYNNTDENGDSLLLYTLSGAPREAFEKFGQPRATKLFGPTFVGQGPIRCDDVTKDPRYGSMAPHYGMPKGHLPVCSYLAVPVISRSGETIGGLFFGHPSPGVFTERAERLVVGVAAQAALAIDNARLFKDTQQLAQTRERLLEIEQNARKEAERMSLMKDEFLATLSHELRTPLTAILGWAQILSEERSESDLIQGLEVIKRNAKMQTKLIEDLLDMSRIVSGKVRLDLQKVDLTQIIDAALDTIKPSAEAKGIELRKILDSFASIAYGDPHRLQQVIWNLLSNAIKFTPKNGKVDIFLLRTTSNIEIRISDSGPGIDPEFIPHVFERFRQADSSITRKHGGLGLGLSIVKQLVELHGGNVKAQNNSSSTHPGAMFIVTLPLPEDFRLKHQESLKEQTPSSISSNLAGLKILIVDDEIDARQMIQRVLSQYDVNVIVAASANEALQLTLLEKPDVIISDLGMPEKDGFQFIREVRKLETKACNTPAIALSAFARLEDRARAKQDGFQVHLAKPIDPAELVSVVAGLKTK